MLNFCQTFLLSDILCSKLIVDSFFVSTIFDWYFRHLRACLRVFIVFLKSKISYSSHVSRLSFLWFSECAIYESKLGDLSMISVTNWFFNPWMLIMLITYMLDALMMWIFNIIKFLVILGGILMMLGIESTLTDTRRKKM